VKIELVHSFDVARSVYEANINNPEILKMCEGRLAYLKSRDLVESREGPGPNQHFWRFRCEADYKMPAAAQKVIGDKLGWFEESVFDRSEHVIRFQVLPPDRLKGRYKCGGDQVFVERGDGGMDRIMTVEMTVGIPIVGRMVEKHILERLEETYVGEMEIQKEFFARVGKKAV
jgi:hypothetical protein